MSDQRRRMRWWLIGLGMMILACVVALLEERDARAALKQSGIDSEKWAEIFRDYYQGDGDDDKRSSD